jgi:hypothetical protein
MYRRYCQISITAQVRNSRVVVEAPKPADGERRLGALHALNLSDAEPDERFDRITRLASASSTPRARPSP